MNCLTKLACALPLIALAAALSFRASLADQEERLPSGKLQREEILKAEHKQSLKDAERLSELAQSLKSELEKNDWSIVSVSSIQKTEEIARLARRIGDRLRRR